MLDTQSAPSPAEPAETIPPVHSEPVAATGNMDLEQVLASRAFERAPTLKKLLVYLWEHRHEEISEYAIATEALRRRADFEPRFDATVRVLVSRLRKRLKEFYDEDGAHLSTRIFIPVGTHQVKVLEIEQNKAGPRESLAALPVEKNEKKLLSHPLVQVQFAVIAILIASVGWLLWQRHQEHEAAAQANAVLLPDFWKQFFGNGKDSRIIIPNPAFFTWADGLMARDIHVNDFSEQGNSKFITSLNKQFGTPSLSQQYVSSTDTFASLQLDHFLGSRRQPITISSTAQTTLDTWGRENIILIGNSHTLANYSPLLNRLEFQVDTNRWLVTNRHPAPGERAEYRTVHEAADRIVTPGVIAFLPGTAGTHVLILLTTYHTSALVSYLTSDEGLKEIQNAQAQSHCPYFQAIVLSAVNGMNGTTTLGNKLLLFRPYCSSRQGDHAAALAFP